MAWREKLGSHFHIRNRIVRGSLAEFLSAFIHVALTITSIAASLFSGNKADYLLHAIHQGLAVFVAASSFLNPAVTFAWSVLGKLSWIKCICYSIAQYCGAFSAAGLLYLTYTDALHYFDGGIRQAFGDNGTAGIFGTYPAAHISVFGSLANSVTCTSILLIAVLAISDRKNWRPESGVFPLVNGGIIVTLNLAFGYNGGAIMNPARDASPRLFSYLAGWGDEVFSLWDYHWFYIPIVSTYVGALLGSFVYTVFIELHWEPDENQKEVIETRVIGMEDVCFEGINKPVLL